MKTKRLDGLYELESSYKRKEMGGMKIVMAAMHQSIALVTTKRTDSQLLSYH